MKHNNEISDRELRLMLAQKLPQAQRNEWFTSRVLNRLPERRRSDYGGVVESVAYGLAMIVVGMMSWVLLGPIAMGRHAVTRGDLVSIGALVGVTVFVTVSYVGPRLRLMMAEL